MASDPDDLDYAILSVCEAVGFWALRLPAHAIVRAYIV
jgi:hypothetical protein